MLVDLLQITAEDGLRLDGAFHSAPTGVTNATRFDALVCIHGTGSNFYSSSLFTKLTPGWLERGINVLWANTRGHDGLSYAVVPQGRRKQGAAFERFAESPHDLRAWADNLVERGCRRIGFFGHSSGALKAIYTQALKPHPKVTGLIAVSPPRLSHAWYAQSAKRREFLDAFRRAEMLIAAGEQHTLLDVTFPMPHTIAAAGYVEKYGPAEAYNILTLLPQVACPTLVTFGSIEVEREVAFQELPTAVAALGGDPARLQTMTLDGADHVYTGRIDELGRVIEPWLTG